MKSTSKPTIKKPKKAADPVGSARIYVEVDAGAGQHVTFDIKIAVQRRNASDFAPVVDELERRPLNSRISIHPTSSPTIRKTDRTSSAFSESEFVCADPSGGGESSAVADKDESLSGREDRGR